MKSWGIAIAAWIGVCACTTEAPPLVDDGSGGEGGTAGQGGTATAGGSGGMAPEPCAALETELQAVLDEAMANVTVRGGYVAGVRTADCTWQGAAGTADSDGSPLTPSHLLRVGSVTKTYIAAALVQLSVDGMFSLDDPLTTHVTTGLPNEDEMTVRQLLGHTAGVFEYLDDSDFVAEFLDHPTVAVAPQEIVDVAIAAGPHFAPGTDWSYSNTGYVVLGMVLEAVTGSAPGQYLRSALLEPLALSNTYLDGEDALPANFANGWQGVFDTTYAVHPSVPWTAGAMVADVGDLVTWTQALVAGDAIDSSARSEMLTFSSESNGTYGLGMIQLQEPGLGKLIGHTGGIPGYLTEAFYLPAHDVTVVTIVNNSALDPNPVWISLAETAIARE